MKPSKISRIKRKTKYRADWDIIIGPSTPWSPEEQAALKAAIERNRSVKLSK